MTFGIKHNILTAAELSSLWRGTFLIGTLLEQSFLFILIRNIEWASALVPPTPLCGGRRAGLVNKTRGEAKNSNQRSYPKQGHGRKDQQRSRITDDHEQSYPNQNHEKNINNHNQTRIIDNLQQS